MLKKEKLHLARTTRRDYTDLNFNNKKKIERLDSLNCHAGKVESKSQAAGDSGTVLATG